MEYKGYQIIDLPVINLETAEQVGIVEDLALDPKSRKIIGLVVRGRGWLKGEQLIPYEALNSIGEDAVTINDDSVFEELDDDQECLNDNSNLIGATVLTEQGQELGVIDDIFLNPNNGQLNGYEISDGVVEDIINGRGFLHASHDFRYGNQVVVVEDVADYQQFKLREE